ncbi:MAG: choice-of-anchor D domain-containing protein [Alphaproteobacteria bacterium]|nr:choice-of-anchor D domain-containing protein [Alphaproteobacteria bacterium]
MSSSFLKFLIFSLAFCALATAVRPSAAQNPAMAQYPGFADPGARSASGTTEGVVPVEQNVDGGTIPIGATAQVVVRFRNDGSQPVEMGLIRLYPSSTVSGTISMNECQNEPLPSGAECAVALSIKGLQAGPWRAEMLMSHSGRTRLVTATLAGKVEPSTGDADRLTTDVEATPNVIDFGDLQSSQTLVEPITLRNITSNPIEISKIYIDTGEQSGYELKTECKKLEAGQACIAVVTWSPKIKGRSSGVLVIEHDGPAGLSSVPLKGQYSPSEVAEAEIFPQAVPGKGLMISSQTTVDFGTDVETASTITVSLVNAGDADLTIQDIRISGSDNGLSFKNDGCLKDTVLKPIEACPLTLTWSPTRVGPLFDDVQVVHDGARGILVLPIRGAATSTVSQDQKAIVLSGGEEIKVIDPATQENEGDVAQQQAEAAARNESLTNGTSYAASVTNPMSMLDGYKITSFSPTRAIINGPGGSRIVFDGEEVVLGGVPWMVIIQKNGIEFLHQGKRVLLLFDRSLSSLNRISSSSSATSSSTNSGSESSSSQTIPSPAPATDG